MRIAPALGDDQPRFHFLHDQDYARLERRMICPKEGRPVHGEHVIRGYEVDEGRYVTVTEDELRSLEPEASDMIEIHSFVDAAAVDPFYFDRPYYLVPMGAERPYSLLVEVLAATGRAGVAEFVMRERKHVALVRSLDGALCLITLRYASEILDAGDVAPASAKPARAKVSAMERALKRLAGKWKPESYRDRYAGSLMRTIERKEKKREIVTAPVSEEEEPPSNLEEALEKSARRAKRSRGKRK